MSKLFPQTVSNESSFIELSKEVKLAYYEIYDATNDYGIFENSKKYDYLDISQNDINELVNYGYLIKLFDDKPIYAITHWNVENEKLKYRKGNSYSEILGKNKNGTYYKKENVANNHSPKNKSYSDNKPVYLFGDNNEDEKSDFD